MTSPPAAHRFLPFLNDYGPSLTGLLPSHAREGVDSSNVVPTRLLRRGEFFENTFGVVRGQRPGKSRVASC